MIPPLAVHVSRLYLDATATHDTLANVLAHLSPFTAPHLRQPSIAADAAIRLLGEGMQIATYDTLREEESLLRSSFGALAAHIYDLLLLDFYPHGTAAILEHFPNLRALRLEHALSFECHDADFAAALARYELVSLQVCMYVEDTDTFFFLDPRWVSEDWPSVETLRSLRITTGQLLEPDWAFVERFSGTLEDVELRFNRFGDGVTSGFPPPVLSATFPRLRSLLLRGTPTDIITLLTFLSPSPIAHLDLEVAILFDAEDQTPLSNGSPFLVALALHLPTLRTLHCWPAFAPSFSHAETANLRAFCLPTNILLRTSSNDSSVSLADADDEVVERSVEVERTCDSADEVLAFAVGRAEAVRLTGDLEGARMLLERARGIKELQELQEAMRIELEEECSVGWISLLLSTSFCVDDKPYF